MRYEWDRAFRALLTLQVNQESQAIRDLKLQLDKKQEELDQLAKISFPNPSTASAVKCADTSRPLITNSSFEKLAISKVEPPKEKEGLSRNDTIADFLSTEAMREREGPPSGP